MDPQLEEDIYGMVLAMGMSMKFKLRELAEKHGIETVPAKGGIMEIPVIWDDMTDLTFEYLDIEWENVMS